MDDTRQTSPEELPTEIPDSQETTAPYVSRASRLNNLEHPGISFVTASSDVFDDELEFSTNSGDSCRTPSHLGFNINGLTPAEAFGVTSNDDMDEQPTQPATQPFFDPRRRETKSALALRDEEDVLCILTPSSRRAHDAVDLVASTTPQHILQNFLAESTPEAARQESQHPTIKEFSEGDSRPAKDIALRMSSRIHDPCMGFVFGRNIHRCDLLLSEAVKTEQKISNIHFRIFVNKHGVLMVEDMSRNGTKIDNVLLRSAKSDARQPAPSMNTITGGSTITVPPQSQQSKPNDEEIRFTVRMPSRDQGQANYNARLEAYVEYIGQAERRAAVAINAGGRVPPPLPMPFNPLTNERKEPSPGTSRIGAATAIFNHGMRWNGGSKYNVVGYIGKGAFAMVYKLSAVSDGEVYAAKEIENRRFMKDNQQGNKLQSEISIMKSLDHPHIVRFVEYAETQLHTYIIMEFVAHGDLTSYTRPDVDVQMPEFMAREMATQIGSALKYLHEKGITHRDLKPDNILVANIEPNVFKLSDFGLSKMVENDETIMRTFCGTILYCAPEIYPAFERMMKGMPARQPGRRMNSRDQTKPYQHSVDTWGLAAVLYHLLTGKPAWSGTTDDQGNAMLANIFYNPVEWQLLTWCGVSAVGVDFLEKMLVIDPSKRPTDDEILSHPFITSSPAKPVADHAEQLDASQLSLIDRTHTEQDQDDELGDYEEIIDKHDNEDNAQAGVDQPDEGEMVVHKADTLMIDKPETDQVQCTTSQHPKRLFGEIPDSALRSSGVLGQNAYAALNISEANDGGLMSPSGVESSQGGPLTSVVLQSSHSAFQREELHQNNIQHSVVPSTPSLLNTEADFRQIALCSSESGRSSPLTAGSADGREQHVSHSMAKRKSHSRTESNDASKSKRMKSSRGPRTSETARYVTRQSDKQGNTQSHAADESFAPSRKEPVHDSAVVIPNAHPSAIDRMSDDEGDQDAQLARGSTSGPKSLLATASNSQDTDDVDLVNDEAAVELSSSVPTNPSEPARPPGYLNHPNTTRDQYGNQLPGSGFTPAEEQALYFGELTPVEGSIKEAPVIVVSNRTNNTFGRSPSCRFTLLLPPPQPGSLPAHVGHCPRNAIDVVMWYPNIEEDIMKDPAAKWYEHPDLTAVLHTRTDVYIKVNGVKLKKGDNKYHRWGCLRTGDIITIFKVRNDSVTEKRGEDYFFLAYRCNFVTGASAKPRPQDGSDPFVVKLSYNLTTPEGRAQQEKAADSQRQISMDVDDDEKVADKDDEDVSQRQNLSDRGKAKGVDKSSRPSSFKGKGKATDHAKSTAKGKSAK